MNGPILSQRGSKQILSKAIVEQDRRTMVRTGTAAAPPTKRASRPGEQGKSARVIAFSIAAVIQLTLAFALLHPSAAPPKPHDNTLQVVLLETPEKPPDPPPPTPPQPPPVQQHALLLPPPAIEIAQPKPPPLPAAPTNSAITLPAPPPPPPPVAAAPGVEDAFKAAVRNAVFAAHHVPEAARLMAVYGETRIGFSLRDGTVGNVRLIAPSGHGSLDDSALAAVRDAHYPPTPEALRGQLLTFEITLYHRRGEP